MSEVLNCYSVSILDVVGNYGCNKSENLNIAVKIVVIDLAKTLIVSMVVAFHASVVIMA